MKLTNKSTIAKNIKNYLNKFSISQDRLSKLAVNPCNTIIKIETETKKNPTFETLAKIAKTLSVRIGDFIK